MKKINFYTISSLSLATLLGLNLTAAITKKETKTTNSKKEAPAKKGETFLDRLETMEQNMAEMHKQMREKMDKMFDESFGDFSEKMDIKSVKTVQKVNVEDKDDNVILTVTLPTKDTKNIGDIKIKAKDQALEGSLKVDNYKIKFFVKDGILFGTSLTKEEKKEETSDDKEKAKTSNMFYSSSSNYITIPEVKNLEKASATISGNKLIITLPKAESKSDWQEIQVNKES